MLNITRRNAISFAPRAPLPCASRCIASQQWRGLRHTLAKGPLLARLQSTTTTSTPAKKSATYTYPELLNIYRSGVFRTVVLGLPRVTTLAMIPIALFLAPNFYFDPNCSNWWIPATFLVAPVPYLLLSFLTGPMVHAIHIRLPVQARQSKVALLRFADQVPSTTWLQIECIRLLPWPTKQQVQFGPLRTIRPSFKIGLSNLEYLPAYSAQQRGKSIWQEIFQRWRGRFYVNMSQTKDRAQATGLWTKIWSQIPEAGTKEAELLRTIPKHERKPVTMANRPVSQDSPAGVSRAAMRRTRG